MVELKYCPMCKSLTHQEKVGEFYHCLGYGAMRGCGVLIPISYAMPGGDMKLRIVEEMEFTEVERREIFFMGDALTPEEQKLFTELYNATKEELLIRVKNGNEKLMAYYEQIKTQKNDPEWDKMVDNLHVAVDRMKQICDFLVFKGYDDCLYIENGKRTRSCVIGDDRPCWVCPSKRNYAEEEMFEGEKPAYVANRRGLKMLSFLRKMGDGTKQTSGAN
jgi:hypothetical protein